MSAINFESSAPLLGGATKRPDKTPPLGAPAAAPPVVAAAASREPLFIADGAAGADLLGLGEALAPLAQLCAHPDAQTPMMIALAGPPGSGKSFAMKRLADAIRASGPSAPLVLSVDAATLTPDAASAIATATWQALARDYPALAAQAAQSGADPEQAAALASARHDELQRKLDAERVARDDVDGRRARLAELVLYQTPGSRIDAFARANRNGIESRLRRFDLLSGDPVANYKDLVRDFAGAGAGSRVSLTLRSIWAYRGQFRLLAWAVVCFALAFGAAKVANISATPAPRGLGSAFDSAADWIHLHADWMDKGVAALILLGLLLLFVNLWRALSFSASLFRGLGLLNSDLRDRRRELDASSARLNQRVASLTSETEAAGRIAETAAKRVNAGGKTMLASPSPAFAQAAAAPAVAARAFMSELGKLMAGGEAGPAPKRLVLAIDNFDALPPADAFDALESLRGLLGPATIAAVAVDPAALGAGASLRERFERLFQIVFNVQGPDAAEKSRMVARLLGGAGAERPPALASAIDEPLSAGESALLTALAPLACATPRRAKRFLNLYRLARATPASRPALALALAVALSDDAQANAEMERLLRQPDAALGDPSGPAALREAVQAARAANDGRISAAEAAQAMDVARRYRLAV